MIDKNKTKRKKNEDQFNMISFDSLIFNRRRKRKRYIYIMDQERYIYIEREIEKKPEG